MNCVDNPEDALDTCCGECGSIWHATANHPAGNAALLASDDEFPPGYDPAEADRLIGRDPRGTQ